jgi:hypothetical protein
MKYKRLFPLLAFALIFSLLMLALPASPALAAAAITLNPTSGPPGQLIIVTGTGFTGPATGVVWFDTDNDGAVDTGEPQVSASADGTGALSVPNPLAAPAVPRGNYNVKADVPLGTIIPDASASFTIIPKTTLSASTGCVGDTVTVVGDGFLNTAPITILYDGVSKGNTSTNTTGTFTGFNLTVPECVKGNHTVRAQETSVPSIYDDATFTVGQKITLNPASGAPGMTVTVNGTGFPASKTITIKYNAVTITTTPTTVTTGATTGSFTATFTVPDSVPGTYTVQASDGTNNATANFSIATNITLNPVTSAASPGCVGDTVTITGSGFKPSSEIDITYASEVIFEDTVTSETDGSFEYDLTVPPSEHGPHTITATDGTNSTEATFYMEEVAPAAPAWLLPTGGEKAGSKAVLDWADVTDGSMPVTYDLQVASDAAFTNIRVSKTGLTTSGYTLSEAEKLESTGEEAPYYWKVRAVDAASNVGDWSISSTFSVGSDWLIYIWIGIGVVVVFLAGFFIGRASRRSYY